MTRLSRLPERNLWDLHGRLLVGDDPGLGPGGCMDVKQELARRLSSPCRLCPRDCGAIRPWQGSGPIPYCRVQGGATVEQQGLFVAEEAFLCPTYEVFLAGCNLRCRFCYLDEANRNPRARPALEPRRVPAAIESAGSPRARSLHIVGGEPTVHLPAVLELARISAGRWPLVWNTNLYSSPSTLRLLEGVIDVVIGDVHFGPGDCGERLAEVPDAWEVAWRSLGLLTEMPLVTMVRHLLLPGHLECCARPVLERLARDHPGLHVHLMGNYTPPFSGLEGMADLRRRPSAEEIRKVRDLARGLGLVLESARHGATRSNP